MLPAWIWHFWKVISPTDNNYRVYLCENHKISYIFLEKTWKNMKKMKTTICEENIYDKNISFWTKVSGIHGYTCKIHCKYILWCLLISICTNYNIGGKNNYCCFFLLSGVHSCCFFCWSVFICVFFSSTYVFLFSINICFFLV